MLAGTFLISALHLPRNFQVRLHRCFHDDPGSSRNRRDIFGRGNHVNAGRPAIRNATGCRAPTRLARSFWQGAVWGIAMISAIIFLIRAFRWIFFRRTGVARLQAYGAMRCCGDLFLFLSASLKNFYFAATRNLRWPRASDSGRRPRLLSAGFGVVHLAQRGRRQSRRAQCVCDRNVFLPDAVAHGKLWFAVGLHAAFDWGETFLFSVPDSGLVAPGHLLNSSFTAPRGSREERWVPKAASWRGESPP